MKKGLFYTIIIGCLIIIIFAITNNSDNNRLKTDVYSTTVIDVYVIKEYKGNVAVFLYNSNSPIQVLDCKIKSLPPDAIEALATGIKVSGIEELQKFIEAYD